MKKLLALILALMMVFSLATVAFADGVDGEEEEPTIPATGTGTITINNIPTLPTTGETGMYYLYKLLDLESYNANSGAYSYTVNSDWTGFFQNNADPDVDDAMNYVTIDSNGYVTWNKDVADSKAADFAKLALAYAEDNGIDPVCSSSSDNFEKISSSSAVFSDLELGYYLVDTTVGALCGLTTTNPDASINAKNGVPTVDKQVQEDSTGNFGDKNTADIGQTVVYKTTVNVHAGAQNFILHDIMSEGLTFKGVVSLEFLDTSAGTTTTIEPTYINADGETVTNYKVVAKVEPYVVDGDPDYQDYIVDADLDCTFEIQFAEGFNKQLDNNDKVMVVYHAMLNRKAAIAGDGNQNQAQLEFGDHFHSTADTTTTKTYGFDIVKTDSGNNLIDGAKFKIYDADKTQDPETKEWNLGNEIAVVPLETDDNGNVLVYRRARADETGVEIVVYQGQVRVVGFDNGTYWLEETEAPDGYNKLSARQDFTISDANLDAIFNGNVFSTGSGVHVVNKTGSMLPETGGMGTMMFVTFGTFTVLAAGVLLVTKKRMAMIED